MLSAVARESGSSRLLEGLRVFVALAIISPWKESVGNRWRSLLIPSHEPGMSVKRFLPEVVPMILVLCSCGRKFKADDQHAGKRTRCPVCGNMLVIGQPAGKAPSNVSDDGEMPSWWFPSGPLAKGSTPSISPLPTRGGIDPEDIHTAVIPSHSSSHPEMPSQGSVRAPVNGISKILVWVIWGALACAVMSTATILWRQTAGKGSGTPVTNPPGSVLLARPAETGGKHHQADPIARVQNTDQGPTVPDTVTRQTIQSASDKLKESVESASASSLTPRLQVLVPAYFYPSGPGLKAWQHLMEATSKIKIVAIANPSSGPGDRRNLDYYRIIQIARDKGMRVVGYISTKYGTRSLIDVQKDIDCWAEYYPQISGFFVDQQSSSADEVSFYLKIRDLARSKIRDALVITNPGTMCHENYFAQSVSDVTCIFAGFEGFDQLKPPLSLKQYSPSRFAALAYQIPDAKAMRQVIKDAIIKRIGYLYISNSLKVDNPWAELPVYWDDEVEAISQID